MNWHEFLPDEFGRCPHHGCPVVRAQNADPVCLLDWLTERTENAVVLDVLPREEGLAGVVLTAGFVLPVEHVINIARPGELREVGLDLAGWRVTDVLYVRGPDEQGGRREELAVEIKPAEEETPGVLLHLNMGVMVYMLFDEMMRHWRAAQGKSA